MEISMHRVARVELRSTKGENWISFIIRTTDGEEYEITCFAPRKGPTTQDLLVGLQNSIADELNAMQPVAPPPLSRYSIDDDEIPF